MEMANSGQAVASAQAKLALIGEARGEFLFLRKVANALRSRLGPEAAIEIEMDPRDLSPGERATVLVPALELSFKQAWEIPASDLSARVAEAEERFGIPNLRRLWLSDLQHWRDGVSEDILARQALGYLAVFDRLLSESPTLVGGFAEDGGRLIKRAFRAAALAHGRRTRMGIPFALPGRLAFIDQERPLEGLSAFDAFEPSPDELEAMSRHIEAIRSSAVQFMEPRDFRVGAARIRNFARLASRSVAGRSPGDHAAHPRTFAADFARQRARVEVLRRLSTTDLRREQAVFYPIHAAHDTQVLVRGEVWRHQLATVQTISEALPLGYQLWVKPHPAAAGELPVSGLAGLQRRLNNVRLIDPTVHAHEVLRQVKAIVTVNSTTGFEALCFGVPVVTLGKALYGVPGVTHIVEDPADLPAVVARALREPALNHEDTVRFFAWCHRISYPVTPIYQDESSANASRYADALIEDFQLGLAGSKR